MGDQRYDDRDGGGKGWWAVIIIGILIVIVVIVVLALTVFRVRDPRITVQSVQVMSFSLTFLNTGPQLSFVLNAVVAVKNKNHASFKYDASTAYLYYRGVNVGSASVPAGEVKSQSTTDIATQLTANSVGFLGNPSLTGDVQSGTIPLVIQTTLHGRIKVASIVKHRATSVATCNFDLFVQTQSVGDFSCSEDFHL